MAAVNRDDFHLGQVLFLSCSHGRRDTTEYELPITKIGRKYLTVGEPESWMTWRIDMETMRVAEEFMHGAAYLYREDWEREQEAHKVFSVFRAKLQYSPAKGVTADNVIQAAALLGIEL